MTSARRGCVTVASASPLMPARVPSQTPAVLSVTEASGTMVTNPLYSYIFHLFHSLCLPSISLSFSLFSSSSLSPVYPSFSFSLSFFSLQVVVCSSARSVTTFCARMTSLSTRPAAKNWKLRTSSVSLVAVLDKTDLLVHEGM